MALMMMSSTWNIYDLDYQTGSMVPSMGWRVGGASHGAGRRTGGHSVACSPGSLGMIWTLTTPATSGTLVAGFAIQANSTSASTTQLFTYYRPDTNPHFYIGINGSAQLTVRDSTNAVIATDATTSFAGPASTWYYVEVKVTGIGTTTHSITIKVDGVTKITTSVTTTTVSIIYVEYATDAGTNFYFTDLYLLDGTGSTNNDFLGDCRVEYLSPTASGALQEWTPNTGTHLAAVAGSPGDTHYLNNGALNQRETFVMSDLLSTAGTIKGVQVNIVAKKDSQSTATTIDGIVRIGGINYVSATAVNRTTQQVTYRDQYGIYDVSPATSTTWTAAEVNGMEAGFTVLS